MSRTYQKIANWLVENRDAETSPVLFYDLEMIQLRMANIRLLGEIHGATFLMAVKSFPHPDVLRAAAQNLSGFDVSNTQELAMIANDDARFVVATGPKLKFPLQFSTGTLPLIFVENTDQLNAMLEKQGSCQFGFRLEWMQMESKPDRSRFGFTWADALKALESLSPKVRKRFVGFHCHRSADGNKADDYVRSARWIYDHASQAGIHLKYLDLGGGQSDLSLDSLETMLLQIREFLPKEIELILEPGRLLSKDAGYAMGTVQSVSMHDDESLVTLDLSKECHLRWSRPRLLRLSQSTGDQVNESRVRFVGPTCFESDSLGSFLLDASRVKVGDRVLFANVSGYCYAWNTSFNGCPPAETVLL